MYNYCLNGGTLSLVWQVKARVLRICVYGEIWVLCLPFQRFSLAWVCVFWLILISLSQPNLILPDSSIQTGSQISESNQVIFVHLNSQGISIRWNSRISQIIYIHNLVKNQNTKKNPTDYTDSLSYFKR